MGDSALGLFIDSWDKSVFILVISGDHVTTYSSERWGLGWVSRAGGGGGGGGGGGVGSISTAIPGLIMLAEAAWINNRYNNNTIVIESLRKAVLLQHRSQQ